MKKVFYILITLLLIYSKSGSGQPCVCTLLGCTNGIVIQLKINMLKEESGI
ncbi:MAG: hypothetical protein R3F25_10055 [Gammaproteobacteria bacterium]